jgi:hypothetical protein
MSFIDKILGGGAIKVAEGVANIVDKFVDTKTEKAERDRLIQAEVNRHMEEMAKDATRQLELENQDRDSARKRESEFVKSTGHIDYIVWVLVIVALAIFGFMVFSVVKGKVPDENRELIFHIFGIVEGFLLSIFSYYFGSSAGSRIKDMRAKL